MAFRTVVCVVIALSVASGCAEDDCPPGQVRYEGRCTDVIPTDPECGPGTWNDNGLCRPETDLCGPGTEVVWVVDASGVRTEEFYCEGDVASDVPDCPPSPDGQRICVSGWARYLMDPVAPCNVMQRRITFGPDATALEVALYDPMVYAGAADPSLVPPLGVAPVNPVDGTFKVEDVAPASSGYVAVVVRSIAPADDFVFTGYPYAFAPGHNIEEVNAYGVTAAQHLSWNETIGATAIEGAAECQAGQSLFECGTWVGVFGYADAEGHVTPLSGVVPFNVTDPLPVASTFYLDDTCAGFDQPASLAESYTGARGVVFVPGARLSNFFGVCADLTPDTLCETEGLTFDQTRVGGAAPQAIFVQLMDPQERP